MNSAKTHRLPRAVVLAMIVALAAMAAATLGAAPASAAFGLSNFDVQFEDADGGAATQAGSHPFAVNTFFDVNLDGNLTDGGDIRDLIIEQIRGMAGDTDAIPRCSNADFANEVASGFLACGDESVVGFAGTKLFFFGLPFTLPAPVYNLEPPPGVPVRIGFKTTGVPLVVDITTKPSRDYNVLANALKIPQPLSVYAAGLQLWGNPADPGHDYARGSQCIFSAAFGSPKGGLGWMSENRFFLGHGQSCPLQGESELTGERPVTPFLTLPRACGGPLLTHYSADSWEKPGAFLFDGTPDLPDANWVTGSVLSHDAASPPNPQGFTGCERLGHEPALEMLPSTNSAETGTGLDVNVDFTDEGLLNPEGLANSDAKKVVLTLPDGVTINPSVGEGLGVCTPAELARETLHSEPGAGCPNASKVGTLQVTTPIADEAIEGSIFLAQQDDPTTSQPGAENPFDSLIALYFVLKNPNLGVIVKEPIKVEPDPQSGQLVVTFDDIPQYPIGHFNAHLRTGVRAALVTPAKCGTYTTEAEFYPWANPTQPVYTTASFEIASGVNGGPCPTAGVPPFNPHFEAGSVNNNAGAFSPFNMRLVRNDGEQDMTKFSSILPPGELGSLAGVSKCPDAAAEAAKAKTGTEEAASPSCPANSLIGHTLAGAGVGSALTYVKGYVYLGGPYKGAPLSVISVTPALAGPFDAGTVVVRLGLDLNPRTAEVEVDGAASDPIPHILKGIVLKVRDLRVYVDRPNFTLNPTDCDESSATATLFGSFLNVLDPADDVPVELRTRYQAANCLNLGFKPDLKLNLKGGTKRGGHPGLNAIYTPRKGDANVEGLVVRLPRSAFLDQAHIKTICTRVQFAQDACPERARYGYIKAFTPLLDEPLEGPVWLRSSNHKLPDLVFDLHGLVDIEVAIRIDSARGGIRATLEDSPDAPLSKVVLRMQGAKKGLIINSRNLCGAKSRANVAFTGHNGKEFSANPVMRAECGGKRSHKQH